jgi:hypothetical protein
MPAPPAPDSMSIDELLEAVDRLSPAQARELERRLAARRRERNNETSGEGSQSPNATLGLPASSERRLRGLIAKSEEGRLTERELADYQALGQEAQRLDAARAEGLAEQARRRKKPARDRTSKAGGEGRKDGA